EDAGQASARSVAVVAQLQAWRQSERPRHVSGPHSDQIPRRFRSQTIRERRFPRESPPSGARVGRHGDSVETSALGGLLESKVRKEKTRRCLSFSFALENNG